MEVILGIERVKFQFKVTRIDYLDVKFNGAVESKGPTPASVIKHFTSEICPTTKFQPLTNNVYQDATRQAKNPSLSVLS